MITHNLLLILLTCGPVIAIAQLKAAGQTVVVHGTSEEEEDILDPPSPEMITKFGTLNDWLIKVCSQAKPKKSIQKYNIGLFEAPGDYTLFIVGVNTYIKSPTRSSTRIEFKPANMYFSLPPAYFKNLSRGQLLNKLAFDLTNFTRTASFKNSFFTKARAVIFESSGKAIWSR